MRIPRRLPTYPYGDNERLSFGDNSDYEFYFNATYLVLDGPAEICLFDLNTAGNMTLYGGGHTTDDLSLYANIADAYPYIKLFGTAGMRCHISLGFSLEVMEEATTVFQFYHDGSGAIVGSALDGHDLFLSTTGTGVVKFGTYTAGLVVCTGTIAAKDAAGNATRILVAQP